MQRLTSFFLLLFCIFAGSLRAQPNDYLKLTDVFEFELASDPQLSPDGSRIVYVRNSMDIMKDRSSPKLWTMHADGSDHRPLTEGASGESSPRWSPDGSRLAFVATVEDGRSIFVRRRETKQDWNQDRGDPSAG